MTDCYYDLEAIKSFIDKVINNERAHYQQFIKSKISGLELPEVDIGQGITRNEYLAVMRALSAVVNVGVDLKKELGVVKKRGRKVGFVRLDETIHSPEFGVVMAYVEGRIKYIEAVDILINEFHVAKTCAQEFIEVRRESAENLVALRDLVTNKTNIAK